MDQLSQTPEMQKFWPCQSVGSFISSHAAVQRRGNEADLFEHDIAAMCEAQQKEDEKCRVEEVSDQDYDEIYRNYCAADVL